jgi:hypothetical protein
VVSAGAATAAQNRGGENLIAAQPLDPQERDERKRQLRNLSPPRRRAADPQISLKIPIERAELPKVTAVGGVATSALVSPETLRPRLTTHLPKPPRPGRRNGDDLRGY